jgi:class IV lanthipeptide synthase
MSDPVNRYRRAFATELAGFLDRLPANWQSDLRRIGALAWRSFRTSDLELPPQGWKLHVSASAMEAVELVRIVLPGLLEFDVAFKVAASFDDVIRINSGEVGLTQVGKVVTVYPGSDGTLEEVIGRLEPLWRPASAPEIPSDMPVSTHGGLWLRYGAFDSANVVTDPLGMTAIALVAPGGELVPDARNHDGVQVQWAPPPPVERTTVNGPGDPSAPVRICGSSYLRLKALAGSVGCRVDLALRLEDRQLAVIKSAVSGARCDPLGNDAVDRLENEHSVLSALQGSDCCPAVRAYDRTQHFLAMEDAGGVVFTDLRPAEKLEQLPAVVDAVAEIHARGFVHRDLKLSNVRSTGAGISLVDFEIAAPSGKPAPMYAGTDGYVPPEGRGAVADPSYDAYGLGGCLTHTCIDHCPSRLPLANNAGRQIGLLKVSGQHVAARIAGAALEARPADRPSARELRSMVMGSMPGLRAELRGGRDRRRPEANPRWATAAAVDAGRSTRDFRVPAETGHWWRNAHLLAGFESEGINIGAAGIVIGLSSIDAALGISHFDADVIGGAEWLASRPAAEHAHGLFTGNAGVALALGLASRRYGRADLLRASRERLGLAAASREPDFDLFSGAAGILWAGCLLSSVLEEQWPLDATRPHADRIHHAAVHSEGLIGWPSSARFDPGRTVYLGAAHGTAGIALALARWGRSTSCERSARLSADALASVFHHGLTDDGENIVATTSGLTRPRHHWCHGVAGYLWCLLQAFDDADELTEARDWAVEAFVGSAPLVDNPTSCHGMAGVLETWRMLTSSPKVGDLARRRAAEAVAVLRLLHHHDSGGTTWSSEEPSVVSPDLWVGFLGPATEVAMSARGMSEPVLSERWLARCASERGPVRSSD